MRGETLSVLRGLTLARLAARSGAGTETILHTLAQSRAKGVGEPTRALVEKLHGGAVADEVLREAISTLERRAKGKHLAKLYGVLLPDVPHADARLRSATAEVVADHELETRAAADGTRVLLKVGLSVLMGPVILPLVAFLKARIGKNFPFDIPSTATMLAMVGLVLVVIVGLMALRRPAP